ncbi:MAG: divergent PAP2 family protein, partial [Leptolyngbya sp. SIO4C5]|nr:divergent PAP2 family protein [Leptolyngbya sp. SIO4C5]
MQDVSEILDNHVLLVALIACLIAQVLKAVIEYLRHGKINLRVLVEMRAEEHTTE